MRISTFSTLIILFLVFMISTNTVYVVKEMDEVVVLRFQKLQETAVAPGLHFKIPFIDKIYRFDGRLLTLDTAPERYLTSEKKALDVDAFVKWKIVDVAKYYTATTGSEDIANDRLLARVRDGLRNEFGIRTKHEVVSGQRDALMENLTTKISASSVKELGIQVVDIRIKRIDLPEKVSDSVFERMKTERDRIARGYRAEGNKKSEELKAQADKEKEIILATADGEAEQIRGEGDAKASEIYAKAYNQDPEFYAFYRSLTAYKATFDSKDDVLVIDPSSAFFKYLKNPSK
jgi:membrane protease subunit HflC